MWLRSESAYEYWRRTICTSTKYVGRINRMRYFAGGRTRLWPRCGWGGRVRSLSESVEWLVDSRQVNNSSAYPESCWLTSALGNGIEWRARRSS